METRSFYALLPSNASMDIYPDNTLTSYKIRLPRTIYLKHNYEVALVEIQYPVSWETFAEDDSYTIRVKTGEGKETVRFPVAYYENISELVQSMNKALGDFFEAKGLPRHEVVLVEETVLQKLRIFIKPGYEVQFSKECCRVLGLRDEQWYFGNVPAPYRHDISHGFHSLYVYYNICDPQIVGDVYAPLLRSVAIKGNRGEHVTKTYGEPHYVPVNTKTLDTIEMNIRDDTGANVPFMSGRVICKLHFRLKSL